MYSAIIINMLTCTAVLIFKFYSKSVESHLISGMAVQRNKQKPTCQYSSDSMSPLAVHGRPCIDVESGYLLIYVFSLSTKFL